MTERNTSGRRLILVTRNTEYHVDDLRCVGVRDSSGAWYSEHRALGEKVQGGIRMETEGGFQMTPGAPQVGERICFTGDLLTSPLEQIRQPAPMGHEFSAA